MRIPLHTRFQDSTFSSFQRFYKANEAKFVEKTKAATDPTDQAINYLETCEGYVVYRTQKSDGSWGSIRVATPEEVRRNSSSILKSSAALRDELKSGSSPQSSPQPSPQRTVSYTAQKSVPHINPPQDIFTPEEKRTANALEALSEDDHTDENEQHFVRACNALIHEYKTGDSEREEHRARLMVHGALIVSGRGIIWPKKTTDQPEDTSTPLSSKMDFDRLQVNFSRLSPDNPDADIEDVINQRVTAARAALKAHEKYMHSPTISSEDIQKEKVTQEISAMVRFIRRRDQKRKLTPPTDITEYLSSICRDVSKDEVEQLLDHDHSEPFKLPHRTVDVVCALSKALVKETEREAEEQFNDTYSRSQERGARHLCPVYKPAFSGRELRNPGLSRRDGVNLFARLHDHAGLPEEAFVATSPESGAIVPDTPFDYDDVEEFRHYYQSTFQPLEDPSKPSPD